MRENWRAVPGWEGLYEASTLGRIRSLDRTYHDHRGTWTKRGRVLKPSVDKWGYERVNLQHLGRREPRTVHRVILETFVGIRPEGMECRHLNGACSDNRLSNLVWGTPKENTEDRRIHGVLMAPQGESHPRAKLTETQVIEIRRRRDRGELCRDLAAEFGVSGQLISRIGLREIWKHIAEAA